MLRKREDHGEKSVQQAERSADRSRHQHARPQIGTVIDRQPAGERAGGHDAFDAEIQNTRAFAQEHTERTEDKRRSDAQHRDPERGGGDDVEHFGHDQRTR